jgi:hypothetical protein
MNNIIGNITYRIITIQELYSKHYYTHEFLKNNGLNNNTNLFFINESWHDYESSAPIILILERHGRLSHIRFTTDYFQLDRIQDDQLKFNLIRQARYEVNHDHSELTEGLLNIEYACGTKKADNALF